MLDGLLNIYIGGSFGCGKTLESLQIQSLTGVVLGTGGECERQGLSVTVIRLVRRINADVDVV
jgi:hypothetical protein